jgi:hypothetical protein
MAKAKRNNGDRKDIIRRHISIGGILEYFAGGEVDIKKLKKFCTSHHIEMRELSKEYADKFDCAYRDDEFMFASFAGKRQMTKTIPPKIDPREIAKTKAIKRKDFASK